MRILSTSYTLSTKSLDIYLAGCNPPHCAECHNPEAWSFDQGKHYTYRQLRLIHEKIKTFDALVERIFIMGGEPLDQSHEKLAQLLRDISYIGKEVWLFTRYELSDVPMPIRKWCDFIKTGRYDTDYVSDNYVSHGIRLASSNQRIWRRKEFFDV